MEDVNSIEDLIGREEEFNNEYYGIEAGSSAGIESDEIICSQTEYFRISSIVHMSVIINIFTNYSIFIN